MRRVRRGSWAAALAAAATWMACGGDGGTGVDNQPPLSGNFTLTDVDGTAVGALPPASTQILAGFLVFTGADRALRILTTLTSPAFGTPYVSTDTLIYTYRRSGSQVVFQYPGGSQVADTGTVSSTARYVRIEVRTRLGLASLHSATFLQQK